MHGLGVEYSFVSRWRVDAAPSRCWDEMERMLQPGAPSWWPGLRVVESPAGVEAGSVMTLAVRSPFGYRLRVRLTVTDVVPGERVDATSAGDLQGVGGVVLEPAGSDSSILTLHWVVRTRKRWMNLAAPALRPVFRLAHALVMRAGEKGLARAVAR